MVSGSVDLSESLNIHESTSGFVFFDPGLYVIWNDNPEKKVPTLPAVVLISLLFSDILNSCGPYRPEWDVLHLQVSNAMLLMRP